MGKTGVQASKVYLRYTALLLIAFLAMFSVSCGGGGSSTPPNTGSLSLSSSTLTFNYTIYDTSVPASQTLNVTSSSGTSIGYSATTDVSNPNWLSVQPSNGTTPGSITVTVLPSNLAAGTYTGHVIVIGANSRATATVTFTVNSTTKPIMDVSPTSLSFTAVQGGSDPLPQLFSVKNDNANSDPTQMSFTLATDSTWLAATSPSSVATASVSVQPHVAGLAPGTYTGKVTVTAPDAANSTATVNVSFTVTPAPPAMQQHSDLRRSVIYQIITDRFYNGDSTNDTPLGYPTNLFDASETDWSKYWGGDLAGIQAKLAYLKQIGVGAIWVSPPVDNIDQGLSSNGTIYAPYHGYSARDYKRIDEHFGDVNKTWVAFDAMVAAAHSQGIKVIIDFAANHSNPRNGAEYGALYDDGVFVTDYNTDASNSLSSAYYHRNPNISDWNDRYQLQYYTLMDLADFNQENPSVDKYLKDSVARLIQHGVDGFRFDAVKHGTWGWEYTLANSANTQYANEAKMASPTNPATGVAAQPPFLFGEWGEGIGDPLYPDSVKFANNSGMALLDYPLYWDVASAFATGGSFNTVDSDVTNEYSNFSYPNDLVTFVDNHDNPRLLSKGATQNQLNEALAFLLTSRGIPVVYYGDEQALHNDTNGGGDPYNRPQMTSFDPTSTGSKVVRYLAALRSSNLALAYGTMQQRWKNNDVYIFERTFNGSVVLVAINKSETTQQVLSGPWATSLPAGTYSDYLIGMLGGVQLSVQSGGSVADQAVTLPAHSVSVWQYSPSANAAAIGAITPNVGQPGVIAAIYGTGFGTTQGTVQVGGAAATVLTWADDAVTFTVPAATAGTQTVTVTPASGSAMTTQFRVLNAEQIPVTFSVQNANPAAGEQVYMTGDVVELGGNATSATAAVGPLLVPPAAGLPPLGTTDYFITTSVPAGTTINFKFLKLSSTGTLDSQESAPHTYTVPAAGACVATPSLCTVTVSWQ